MTVMVGLIEIVALFMVEIVGERARPGSSSVHGPDLEVTGQPSLAVG
jgi:hypothetical protein